MKKKDAFVNLFLNETCRKKGADSVSAGNYLISRQTYFNFGLRL
ncbi:hypothetical protein DET61_11175 [Marinobacter nauticus]|jgi:hypothetical protein|uniref:Uncharacterized protein n=1 Tax=Marinobacter nauticus TaxID=2743 RepID=A0A368V6X4_MARNT|nr:hypothetical protein F6453_1026 [Marinobacter nauticus]RBP74022.1 hypothetical protein DET64_105147 [Marinobacter nauticus]RCW34771.1 hypothetical protein DET51_105146 [Marinobacter nauticus]RCW65973.1 hypothetical protein DET61_11175 [Marinobacter nauticus]RKR78736.1 hypothetical protein C7436_0156 [Marinobacter nauticus]